MAINYCVNCGARLEENDRICPMCGDPVPQAVVYAQDETQTPEIDKTGDTAALDASCTHNADTAGDDHEIDADIDTGVDLDFVADADANIDLDFVADDADAGAAGGNHEIDADIDTGIDLDFVAGDDADADAKIDADFDTDAAADAAADVGVDTDAAANVGVDAEDASSETALAEASNTNGEAEEATVSDEATEADESTGADIEEDFTKYADLSGFDIIGNYPTYAPHQPKPAPDRTGVMPPEGGQRVTAYAAPPPEKQRSHAPKWIAVAAAIVLASGVIGLLANPHARDMLQQRLFDQENAEAASSALTDENARTNTLAASATDAMQTRSETLTSVSDARAAVSEDEAFDTLVSTYDRLQSYNDRVYSCLQTYNGAIVVADRGQREAAAGIATSLLAEIEKEQHAIDALNIGRASDLYDDYVNVRRLLDDQYQRLAVIVESWEISLSYNNPYDHQDEILEPLRRDVSANGTNIYLDDFDETYWDSRPTR